MVPVPVGICYAVVMEEMMTPRQAAQALGITSRAVRDAIQRGSLPATRLSERVLLIRRSAVEQYRRERLGVNGLKRWWRLQREAKNAGEARE